MYIDENFFCENKSSLPYYKSVLLSRVQEHGSDREKPSIETV